MKIIRWKREFSVSIVLLVCVGLNSVSGQTALEVYEPADTTSPRATLKSFLDISNRLYGIIESERFFDRTSSYYRPMAMQLFDCLDTSDVPEFEKEQYIALAAVSIKEILDRVDLPDIDDIPGEDEVLPEEGEPIKHWKIPGTRLAIEKIEDGLRQGEFLFSRATVDSARERYHIIKSKPYRTTGPKVSPLFYEWFTKAPGHPLIARIVDALPNWAKKEFWGMSVWKWTGLMVTITITLAIMGTLYWLQIRIADKHQNSIVWYSLTLFFAVAATLMPLVFKYVVDEYLTFRGTELYVASFSAYVVTLLSLIFVIFGLGNRVAAFFISSPKINPRGLDAQFIKIVSKLLSIILATIVFLEGGRYLGVPVTTLLASAGVGGVAVALAVQDTLKNVFGTIMLLSDKPFRVGDRIIFRGYDGFVEDIGLRSTSIRLLTGNQVIIPNDELARADIENVGRRKHIRQQILVELPVDTSIEKLDGALDIVNECVKNHEGMDESLPPKVFLKEMNRYSLGIEVTYWYHPPEYWEFMAFNEKLSLKIFRQLRAKDIELAKVPALSIQMNDAGQQSD